VVIRRWLSIGVGRAADFLDHRLPWVAAIARPVWWKVGGPLGRPGYWADRQHLRYYQEVVRLARVYVPEGRSVLDVGAADTMVLDRMGWFQRRVVLDRSRIPPRPRIERVQSDFLDYRPDTLFDLVICLQVVEHLDDPVTFARKLLETGRTLIVSVPHEWPADRRKGHVQDPVTEAKLVGWMGRPAVETKIVRDGSADRLIAVFRGSAPR